MVSVSVSAMRDSPAAGPSMISMASVRMGRPAEPYGIVRASDTAG
jgi:hypothetical protein